MNEIKIKAIIEDMIDEYKNERKPGLSRLYHIIKLYLDEETDEEIYERYKHAIAGRGE